jgi:HTH-type transcriptional regulator/antitoxin HigA
MQQTHWYKLETESDYKKAFKRFNEILYIKKGSPFYKERMLLSLLIQEYEASKWDLPEVDPIELIKVRMEDFGYKPADLAKEYGDKGTVSKVLNYKQPLSLTMIRKFSELLHIPVSQLIKEYKLN